MLTDLKAANAVPASILECRLVRKGNNAITQVYVTWTGLPPTSATWEDYHMLKARFLHLVGDKQRNRRGEMSRRLSEDDVKPA